MKKMMMNLRLSLNLVLLAAVAAAAKPVTYVFGDSLSEVGNNNYLQSLAKANYPWYGVDYPGGKSTGRFTNGRTIGDIISEKLGIPSPSPYLSLAPNDDRLLEGVNYASGGAGILNHTGLYFIQRLSFDDQIDSFNQTKQAIVGKIGAVAADRFCRRALYFISIGSNDYVNNFLQPFSADGQEYTHDDFVELLASTFKEQLTRLHQLGARRMAIHGLGPLGCIPSQRVKSKQGECLKRVNEWVLVFNGRIQKLIASLNQQLPSGARLIFADTYPTVLDLITNPTTYGFKVSNSSCCNVDTTLGGLCFQSSKLCKNRHDYVFWDAFHPSDAANQVLADQIFPTLFPESPSPAPAPASPKPH